MLVTAAAVDVIVVVVVVMMIVVTADVIVDGAVCLLDKNCVIVFSVLPIDVLYSEREYYSIVISYNIFTNLFDIVS